MESETAAILGLPRRVHEIIYRYAGVPIDTEIHLNGSSDMLKVYQVRPRPPSLFASHALLPTCPRFYAEVSHLLFATNLILLKPAVPNDLRLLSSLRPRTLKIIQRLTVHLNSISGLPHEQCEKSFHGYISSCVGKPASRPLSLCAKDECLLDEWRLAISHVLEHATPHRLCLHVVCDCEDLQTARHVTAPISNSGIVLANCALRLARTHTPDLSREASTVAHRAMGVADLRHPFPFMRLPLELQRLVLMFTDLVTSLREVEWAPQLGYHFRLNWDSCSGGRQPYCGDVHHACRSINCWEKQQDGCFCQRYHSAYSRHCQRWLNHQSLLCVSRSFKEAADAVFFRQNRFVVRSKRGFDKAAKVTPRRIAPTIFFTSRANELRHLTYLELVFPPGDHDYLRPGEAAYPKWLDSIGLAAGALNLPHLTFFVVMADHHASGTNITHFRHHITRAQGNAIIEIYFRVIQPLARLKEGGLRRFFVSLAWPYRWTESGKSRLRTDKASVAREVAVLERQVEQAVMGSDYDSLAVGKANIPRTQWVHKY